MEPLLRERLRRINLRNDEPWLARHGVEVEGV